MYKKSKLDRVKEVLTVNETFEIRGSSDTPHEFNFNQSEDARDDGAHDSPAKERRRCHDSSALAVVAVSCLALLRCHVFHVTYFLHMSRAK